MFTLLHILCDCNRITWRQMLICRIPSFQFEDFLFFPLLSYIKEEEEKNFPYSCLPGGLITEALQVWEQTSVRSLITPGEACMHAWGKTGEIIRIIERGGIHGVSTIPQRLYVIIILWRHTYKPRQSSNNIRLIDFSKAQYLTSLQNKSSIFNAAVHGFNAKFINFSLLYRLENSYLAVALIAYYYACFICYSCIPFNGSYLKRMALCWPFVCTS